MSAEHHTDVIRQALHALGQGNIEGFLADTTDDFHFTLAGTPPGGNTVQGKQQMIELLTVVFGKHLERSAIAMTIENMIAEGDCVVEQAHGEARTLDGQDYNNVYCRVWRFREGKIAALTEYMDTALARQCLWS